MSDNLADMFGAELNKKKPKPKKEKQKITPPPADESYEKKLAEAFSSAPDSDMDDLYEESSKAKLEQEISKAETMKYRAEQERLKLKRAAGDVMEFDKGDLLFFGFIDKGSIDVLRVMDKLSPTIKNLVTEDDEPAIRLLVNRELQNILTDIREEQAEMVAKWRRGLK